MLLIRVDIVVVIQAGEEQLQIGELVLSLLVFLFGLLLLLLLLLAGNQVEDALFVVDVQHAALDNGADL